jgi:hypothetical protein
MSYSAIARKAESRRQPRHPVSGTMRILWEDSDGREKVSSATIVNVSANGAKLRLDERIPVRCYVACNSMSLGIVGRASVRYCVFNKGKYEIGLEFGGDSGFRASKSLDPGDPRHDPKS